MSYGCKLCKTEFPWQLLSSRTLQNGYSVVCPSTTMVVGNMCCWEVPARHLVTLPQDCNCCQQKNCTGQSITCILTRYLRTKKLYSYYRGLPSLAEQHMKLHSSWQHTSLLRNSYIIKEYINPVLITVTQCIDTLYMCVCYCILVHAGDKFIEYYLVLNWYFSLFVFIWFITWFKFACII